jgi:hypothetical protein
VSETHAGTSRFLSGPEGSPIHFAGEVSFCRCDSQVDQCAAHEGGRP